MLTLNQFSAYPVLYLVLRISYNVPSAEAVPDKDKENVQHLFSAKRNFIVQPLDIPGIAFLRCVRHSFAFTYAF